MIGVSAFEGATSLARVVFAAVVNAVPHRIFRGCTALRLITNISDSVEAIETQAFEGCAKLQGFNLPNELTSIGVRAFGSCARLSTLGPGFFRKLRLIDSMAFIGCSSLRAMTLRVTNLTWVGARAFLDSGLTAAHFPSSLTTIKDHAFEGAVNLSQVTFDASTGAISIGEDAFKETALVGIVLPPNATLASRAFRNISTLVTFKGGPFRSTVADVFGGCGCLSSCPNVTANITFDVCNCSPCPTAGAVFDMGGEMRNLTESMDSQTLNSTGMQLIAASARSMMRLRRSSQNPVGPSDTRTAVLMMDKFRDNTHASHLMSRDTVVDFIDMVANFTGEFMAWGCDQTELDNPIVKSIEDLLANATSSLVSLNETGLFGYQSTWSLTRITVQERGAAFEFTEGLGVTFLIPAATLSGNESLVGATFSEYLDCRLFISELNRSETQVGSTVITVEGTNVINGYVEGVFAHRFNANTSMMNSTRLKPSCVYFVEPSNGSLAGSWSTAGCRTAVINDTHTRCRCTHLTSFAVLVSADDSTTNEDARALSAITYAGVTVSLLGIILTICTLLSVPTLREQLRYQILIDLVSALGMALLFFCLLTTPTTTASCEMVSFGALYFFVASLLWNVVDAYDLWKTFVVVFNDGQVRRAYYMARFRLFAWGGALIPPLIALAVDRPNFTTSVDTKDGTEPSLCWINMATPLRWAFLGPVLLVLAVNLRTARQIIVAVRQNINHKWMRSALHTAKIIATVSACTGLAWVFAVMVVLTSEVAFSYLFAVFASTQGAAIFYFHVYQNTISRNSWSQTISRLSSGSSGSSHSSYRKGGRGNVVVSRRGGRSTAGQADAESSTTTVSTRGSAPWQHRSNRNTLDMVHSADDVDLCIVPGLFVYTGDSTSDTAAKLPPPQDAVCAGSLAGGTSQSPEKSLEGGRSFTLTHAPQMPSLVRTSAV